MYGNQLLVDSDQLVLGLNVWTVQAFGPVILSFKFTQDIFSPKIAIYFQYTRWTVYVLVPAMFFSMFTHEIAFHLKF